MRGICSKNFQAYALWNLSLAIRAQSQYIRKKLGPFYLRLRNTTFMRGLLETRNENYPAWASRVFQVTLIFNKVVNKHMIRLTHSHVATTKQDHQ